MPPPLEEDGVIDYFDGTPSTRTQMAKDVTAFLQCVPGSSWSFNWCCLCAARHLPSLGLTRALASAPFLCVKRAAPRRWAAEPEHDDRKLMGFKWLVAMGIAMVLTTYYKRFKWAPIKNRRLEFEN